jgi:hypothetical protein
MALFDHPVQPTVGGTASTPPAVLLGEDMFTRRAKALERLLAFGEAHPLTPGDGGLKELRAVDWR